MSLKRLAAPAFWPVEKKTKKYVMDPKPGPHSKKGSMPLGLVIRDILKYAQSSKEADMILRGGHVKVNAKVRKERRFSVGLMDVISMGDDHYRVLPNKRGLSIFKIDKKEAGTRLAKIVNKTCVKGGKYQLNLHDGSNILIDKDSYFTEDIILLDVEQNKIKDVIKFEKGSKALVIGGRNMGSIVTISDIITTRSSMPNQIVVELGGKVFTLPHNYVFPVGRESPVISLGEQR